ncbi:MAG: hypothetical protein P8K81_00590 [Flavobacteriales bacterium]|nr:hypothetical protein [Flavobacteriales bacterium]
MKRATDWETRSAGRSSIQHPFYFAPVGHVLGEDGLESRVVRSFEEVGQFVEDHVVRADGRMLDQLEVEYDIGRAWAACTPLSFHGADADVGAADAECLFPSRNVCVEKLLELAAVSTLQESSDGLGVLGFAGMDVDDPSGGVVGVVGVEGHARSAGGLVQHEGVRLAEEDVLFAVGVAQFRCGRKCRDAGLLLADPRDFG